MNDPQSAELFELNQRLLESIAARDWETYAALCDPSLTAFEPESCGHLVEGLEFHRFYFQPGPAERKINVTMASPRVGLMGEAAVVAYVRLNQFVDAQGNWQVQAVEETRVWQRRDGRWRHVHFHRSRCPG